LALSRALGAACSAFAAGEHRASALEVLARAELRDVEPDYFALADARTLEPVDVCDGGTVAMVAARVGRTRLIDNALLGRGVEG